MEKFCKAVQGIVLLLSFLFSVLWAFTGTRGFLAAAIICYIVGALVSEGKQSLNEFFHKISGLVSRLDYCGRALIEGILLVFAGFVTVVFLRQFVDSPIPEIVYALFGLFAMIRFFYWFWRDLQELKRIEI